MFIAYVHSGVLLQILEGCGQKVDYDNMTQAEAMPMWIGLSGGILASQAYSFFLTHNIKPLDFVDLQQEQADDMLAVSNSS